MDQGRHLVGQPDPVPAAGAGARGRGCSNPEIAQILSSAAPGSPTATFKPRALTALDHRCLPGRTTAPPVEQNLDPLANDPTTSPAATNQSSDRCFDDPWVVAFAAHPAATTGRCGERGPRVQIHPSARPAGGRSLRLLGRELSVMTKFSGVGVSARGRGRCGAGLTG